jgi:DNA-binding PadR family transcriptional regulator
MARKSKYDWGTSTWCVLALLIEKPSHGYEVSQRYDMRFGSIASLSVPRVYAAIDHLNEAGLVEAARLHTPGKAVSKQELMRHSYRVTAAGRKAWQRWLVAVIREDEPHREMLARIMAAGVFGVELVLEVLARYEKACVKELKALEARGGAGRDSASVEQVVAELMVDQRVRTLKARRDWARDAKAALDERRELDLEKLDAPVAVGTA